MQKMNLEYGKSALEKKESVLLEQSGLGDYFEALEKSIKAKRRFLA
jgi:hypothetical protein